MVSTTMHRNNSVPMAHRLAVVGPSIVPPVACGMYRRAPKKTTAGAPPHAEFVDFLLGLPTFRQIFAKYSFAGY
jgi:hypothetical protein